MQTEEMHLNSVVGCAEMEVCGVRVKKMRDCADAFQIIKGFSMDERGAAPSNVI